MTTLRTTSLSFNQRRAIVGATLVLAILSVGNHILGWGFGAPHSKKIVVASFLLLALICVMFIPTKAEWDRHRARNGSRG
jgi:hypothetical protein